MNRTKDKAAHGLLNLGLVLAAGVALSSNLSLPLKLPLTILLSWGAIKHQRTHELAPADWLMGVASATKGATSELDFLAGKASDRFNFKPLENKRIKPFVHFMRDLDDQLKVMGIDAEAMYRRISSGDIRNTIFGGISREGKSIAAHFALHLWLKANPNLVVWIYDPNFRMGKDTDFLPTWCGIPEGLPQPGEMRSCVVTNKDDFKILWGRYYASFCHRRREKIDGRHPEGFEHLFIIEESTFLFTPDMEAEVKQLGEVATQGQKMNEFIWFVTHTLTKTEWNLDRSTVRQCNVLMGVRMAEDSYQKAGSPQSMKHPSDRAKQYIQTLKGKDQQGFLTNMEFGDSYFPPPPIQGTKDLEFEFVFDEVPDELQKEFDARLQNPDIKEAIDRYLTGELEADGSLSPKKQLFKIVWGKSYNSKSYKRESDILNRYLAKAEEA
ncbi:hypothetical protein IQ268_28050 [Oculatella sp. LEGE 06141]|uniref:hypothetical protein n=1 Tax=Oculatella sp. LEGE 06141 TaxID=1828648 RepID=UPI0018802E1C|nr:hypothetical protein [Oculatella sp. LEGE 06141]MBE9182405.1 hypothetical protein [Oculatella sp. LEGE 06141]